MKRKVGLIILDGWGIAKDKKRSAIDMANTPFVDAMTEKYPTSTLVTYGLEVGLPEGQMGNSEVGHLNIGAGRVVYQDLALINKAIAEDTLKENAALIEAIAYAKAKNKPIHLMGLLSDGGVHSHINHLLSLVDIMEDNAMPQVYIHAFLDGRDTDPRGGLGYINTLNQHLDGKQAQLATVIGRYYAMDRDKRWERIGLAYDLLVNGVGEAVDDISTLLSASYADGVTDEFIKPATINGVEAKISEGDVVLFFNYRTDRPRQITEVLTQNQQEELKPIPNLHFVTMTQYDETFEGLHVMFSKDNLVNTLGEVIADAGLTQLRIAETEKYPHVTFFFNGGREEPYTGEQRIVVSSPKVATYDLQPEMSAGEVTESICNAINTDTPDFYCLNYANTDMVGHTGIVEAAVKSVETVDAYLKTLVETSLAKGYDLIIIADHGNSDVIMNEDGSPNTAHTTNLVPIWYVSNDLVNNTIKAGKLGDVAPTVLALMGMDQPVEMTGDSLL